MLHPEPQNIDGLPLSPTARQNLRRLVALVAAAHAKAEDPDALEAAAVVLGAFHKAHHVRSGTWIPRRVFRAGRAVVRSRHAAGEEARAHVVAAAMGAPRSGLLAAIAGGLK